MRQFLHRPGQGLPQMKAASGRENRSKADQAGDRSRLERTINNLFTPSGYALESSLVLALSGPKPKPGDEGAALGGGTPGVASV